MKRLKEKLLLVAAVGGIWILLSWPVNRDELIAGIVIAGIIVFLPLKGLRVLSEYKLSLKGLIYTVAYLFVFLFALIKSNLDVALRVLSPRLPINPGIVKVRTKLKSPLGRVALANSITLTPGTITVDTQGEYFYVHWLNVTGEDTEAHTKQIVSDFEKYLEVIFG